MDISHVAGYLLIDGILEMSCQGVSGPTGLPVCGWGGGDLDYHKAGFIAQLGPALFSICSFSLPWLMGPGQLPDGSNPIRSLDMILQDNWEKPELRKSRFLSCHPVLP